MKTTRSSISCMAIFLFFVFPMDKVFSQLTTHRILVDGVVRTYLVYTPSQFKNSERLPVIIALHGGGGTAERTVPFYQLNPLADKYGYIVVYPNAIHKAWNIPGTASRVRNMDTTIDDVHFMEVLIDTLSAEYKIDTQKIFFVGMSRGAMFSLYLAEVLNSRIAGVGVVCGSLSKQNAVKYHLQNPIPFIIINGTDDPLVPFNGGFGKWNRNNQTAAANFISTSELVQLLLQENHCESVKGNIYPIADLVRTDGCSATVTFYACKKAPIELITVQNGGHTWPGSTQYLPKMLVGRVCKDFSEAEKIVEFFNSIIHT
ncbi:MAG: hypothetical protein K6T34_09355 [Thermoflavifilum sp.]|nr:hypothetical protein [Thermoflavifilum sp.]